MHRYTECIPWFLRHAPDALRLVGSDAPGTNLEDYTPEFRRLFNEVDQGIAKGRSNYESLGGIIPSEFFLTQLKCPPIGRDMNEAVGSLVVREHKGAVK